MRRNDHQDGLAAHRKIGNDMQLAQTASTARAPDLAGRARASVGQLLQQTDERRSTLRCQETADAVSDEVVSCDPKQFGPSQIRFDEPSIENHGEVSDGRAIKQGLVAIPFLSNLLLVGLQLSVLQVQLHLMRLQLMQQLERLAGTVRVAGHLEEERQRVRTDRPAAGR